MLALGRTGTVAAIAVALGLGVGGCGKDGGFLTSDTEPEARTITGAEAAQPALPGGPTVAELQSGKAACDKQGAEAFTDPGGDLSYGDELGMDSSPAQLPPSVVPARALLRGGEEIGAVVAAGSPQDGVRAGYVAAVGRQAEAEGITVRPTQVGGKPALAYRSADRAQIAVAGTCRAWVVSADSGQSARAVAATLVGGE